MWARLIIGVTRDPAFASSLYQLAQAIAMSMDAGGGDAGGGDEPMSSEDELARAIAMSIAEAENDDQDQDQEGADSNQPWRPGKISGVDWLAYFSL